MHTHACRHTYTCAHACTWWQFLQSLTLIKQQCLSAASHWPFLQPGLSNFDISPFSHSLTEASWLKMSCDQDRLLTSRRAKYLKDNNHIWLREREKKQPMFHNGPTAVCVQSAGSAIQDYEIRARSLSVPGRGAECIFFPSYKKDVHYL